MVDEFEDVVIGCGAIFEGLAITLSFGSQTVSLAVHDDPERFKQSLAEFLDIASSYSEDLLHADRDRQVARSFMEHLAGWRLPRLDQGDKSMDKSTGPAPPS